MHQMCSKNTKKSCSRNKTNTYTCRHQAVGAFNAQREQGTDLPHLSLRKSNSTRSTRSCSGGILESAHGILSWLSTSEYHHAAFCANSNRTLADNVRLRRGYTLGD